MTDSAAPLVILSVTNDLSHDQRVHKMALTLLKHGYRVHAVGRQRRGSLPLSQRPYATTRLPMWFQQGKLFYLEFHVRLFLWLLRRPASILTANDLDTLLPNYLVAFLKQQSLVYDTHELFTEVPELIHRPVTQGMWLALERWLFPRVRRISTVGVQIAAVYRQRYGQPMRVIRNLPPYRSPEEVQQALARPAPPEAQADERPAVIYQGHIKSGRGIELMLAALQHSTRFQLWIVGGGIRYEEMRTLAGKLDVADQVRFWGLRPFEELGDISPRAALGLSLEDPEAANTRLSSPNKLFDYVQARIPVLVANLPVHRQVVETYGVGEVLAKRDPAQLAAQIEAMLADEARYKHYQANTHAAAQALCWEAEEPKVLALYEAEPDVPAG